MAEIKPKLRVDVNHNPTKKGIKVQFVLPQTLEGDAKAQATQKLQSKLNQGLEQYNLTVSQDTDVPYSNVIGFLIPIADIKLLIKNAMGGETQAEPAPEEAPAPEAAPEEPIKEIKRMQELAGLKEFQDVSSEDFQIEEVNRIIAAAIRAITSDVDKQDKIFDFFEITKDNKYNTFIIAKQLAAGKINVEGIKMKVANVAKKLGIM